MTDTTETEEKSDEVEQLEDFSSFTGSIGQGIADLGWSKPMPVQQAVIPVMRRGTDVIVQAVTGSGKTGAFGLPIAEAIDPEMRVIQALVLAPTRELAAQIGLEVSAMGKHAGIETLPVYGGHRLRAPARRARAGRAHDRGNPGTRARPSEVGTHEARRPAGADLRRGRRAALAGLLARHEGDAEASCRERQPQTGLFSATIPERVQARWRASS